MRSNVTKREHKSYKLWDAWFAPMASRVDLLRNALKHFCGNFRAKAAGIRFTRGQSVVLPKFVASVSTTAQTKMFAALMACLYPKGHVFEEALKSFSSR